MKISLIDRKYNFDIEYLNNWWALCAEYSCTKRWGDQCIPRTPDNSSYRRIKVSLHFFKAAVCSVQCAVCRVQCALCRVQCALCSVQCEVCSVHCAVCSKCTVCTVQCAVQCALCIVQCTYWIKEYRTNSIKGEARLFHITESDTFYAETALF